MAAMEAMIIATVTMTKIHMIVATLITFTGTEKTKPSQISFSTLGNELTYPRDIHLMYLAAFSGFILMFIPVTNISS